ncbi:hypothetical protein D9M68_904280 [compost metagenome]
MLTAGLEFADFLDAGIQHGDFLAQEVITRVLVLDSRIEVLVAKKDQSGRCQEDAAQGNQEALLALFAKLLAPR